MLPSDGASPEEILEQLRRLRTEDLDLSRATSYHFDSGNDDVRSVAVAAAATAWGRNGLDPTAFPSVASIENDLCAWAIDLHGGDCDAVGTVTSGGTESCILAVLGARERFRQRGTAGVPKLLLPQTAHPAFRKAAWLLGLEVVEVGIDRSFRVDSEAMVSAMDDQTAIVVVSAPNYAHGVLDPVAPIADAAARRGIWCHLDLCIGGWALPFFVDPPVDMSLTGITSASLDLHKYGYAPKGVSILLHATAADRQGQYFADAVWPGYPLVNNTLQSSRSAAPAAAAWAVLKLLGRNGLAALATQARLGALRLAEGVGQIPGLTLVAPPEATLVCIGDTGAAAGPDIRVVADTAKTMGWPLQVQPARLGAPSNLHVSVSAGIADRVDELLGVLRVAAAGATGRGRADAGAHVTSAVASLNPETLDDSALEGLLQMAGFDMAGDLHLPEETAGINALIDALPASVVETLLKKVLSEIFTPAN